MKLSLFLLLIMLAMTSVFLFPYFIAHRNTIYSFEFSHDSFDQIEKGNDEEKIFQTLGQPLKTIQNQNENENEIILVYSNKKKDTHYFQKTIFIKDGKVSEKIDMLYFD